MSVPKAPTSFLNPFLSFLLAAFLILNLSAEMINAQMFPQMDQVFRRSNILLDASAQQSQDFFDEYLYTMNDYNVFKQNMDKTTQITHEFVNYIDTIRTDLEQEIQYLAPLNALTDKDIPQYYFFSDGKTARATQIKTKIIETNQQLLEILKSFYEYIRSHGGNSELEMKYLSEQLLLKMDENEWKNAPNQTWEAAIFENMSVSGCLAMLSKLQNDARMDEVSLIQYFASKVSYCGGTYDRFEPASVPKKQFVFEGEQFRTEIFLTSSRVRDRYRGDISYITDGITLPIKRRKGIFETRSSEVGEKSYTIDITYQNAFTQQMEHISKTFQYEVVRPSVRCTADKMDVIYIGVPQPISVQAAGIPSDSLQVSCTGCTLKPKGAGKFIATATEQGIAKIHVAVKKGHQSFSFRVKLPPNPVPTLSMKKSGNMTVKEMRAQFRILLEANDLAIQYDVKSFVLMRVPHSDRAHPVATVVKSGNFDAAALNLVAAAEAGDWYCFYDIQAIAPSDKAIRDIGSMNFLIF